MDPSVWLTLMIVSAPGIVGELVALGGSSPDSSPHWAERFDMTPHTGKYLDPLTHVVHHYDASTGVLTPQDEVSGIVLYAEIDVHPRGTLPSFDSPYLDRERPGLTACDLDVCATALLAFVGSHKVQLALDILPASPTCRQVELRSSPQYATTPVTAANARLGADYCAPGVAQGRLLVDDRVVAADESSY